jgi:AsmA-like protein
MSIRLVRWSIVVALGALAGLAIVAGFGSRTSTLRNLVVETLAERLDSEIELGAFSVDTFPTVHITGSALVIRHKGRRDVPPLVSIEGFTMDGGLFGLLSRPRRFRTVAVTGLRVNIPPGGFKDDDSQAAVVGEPAADASQGSDKPADAPAGAAADVDDDDADPAAIVVDRLVADGAALALIPRRADKEPKIFAVHHLTMEPLGRGKVMSYVATLTNPLPQGLIDTSGEFGPWNRENPGGTPLTGRYTFENVDLSTVKGIGGHLTSTGRFQGQLDRIAVSGETRTPDFFLKVSGNPLPLQTKFEASVDGTDGDTYLNSVSGTLLRTPMQVRGKVVGAEGRKGRVVQMTVAIEDGRIEDLLRLTMRGEEPLMRGRLTLHAGMNLPAGPADVMERLDISGELALAEARFTSRSVQGKISTMSERARGLDPDEHSGEVATNLRAKFVLDRGVLTLRDASFGMPGATVQVGGTYGLFSEAIQFDGTVRMKATVSQAAGGWKGILLKPFDPIFRKKGAGAVIPIRVRGSRKDPSFGLDVGRTFGHN